MANLSQRIYTSTPHKVCILFIIHPICIPFNENRRRRERRASSRCRSSSASKRTKRKLTLIAGSSTPSVQYYSPMYVFCSTSIRCPHLHLPPLESLRHQFKCRRRMRRNRRPEGQLAHTGISRCGMTRWGRDRCRNTFWARRCMVQAQTSSRKICISARRGSSDVKSAYAVTDVPDQVLG
jgi:hypothetical protein